MINEPTPPTLTDEHFEQMSRLAARMPEQLPMQSRYLLAARNLLEGQGMNYYQIDTLGRLAYPSLPRPLTKALCPLPVRGLRSVVAPSTCAEAC